MRVRTRIDTDGLTAGLEADLARGVTLAMREAGAALQQDLRAETDAAFKGNKLAKTWRLKVYPEASDSAAAAAWVWTKAPKIVDAFDRGATIRARGGKWLAIPTENAGKYGQRRDANTGFGHIFGRRNAADQRTVERVTPGGFERRTGMKLRFVYDGSGRRAFLVVDKARRLASGVAAPYRPKGRGSKLYGPEGHTLVVFILVPQVTLTKRLDLDAAAQRAANRIPALLTKHWR